MPIYEYECSACGHQLEAIQKFSDAPLTECPKCHKQSLNKLVSAAGFQLKGTGWYATDFRNKGKPSEKTEKNDKTDTTDKTDKTDTTTSESSKGKDDKKSSSTTGDAT